MPDDIRDRVRREAERLPAARGLRARRGLRAGASGDAMRIHPLVYLAARHPQMLAEHAKAYGDLLLEEGRRTLSSLVLHAVLYAAAGVLGLLGLVFGGVALLLHAAIASEPRDGWLLVALPCGTLLAACARFVTARVLPVEVSLEVLGRQVLADIDMIHEAGQS